VGIYGGVDELIEIELARLVIQEKGDQQYIHLRERTGERAFPIVIGFSEAMEISRKLRGAQMPRPMTHDLVTKVLDTLGWTLERIVINDLRDSTFFALLVLRSATNGKSQEKVVDCRPSDAIALAAQARCKIYVSKKVLDEVAPA
jgi:bifunctional DNase/RNase